MNVYHKNYHPDFIKELPVNFEKMKNINLDNIPTDYHKLFTTDWNWGRYSTMSMEKRILLHELYLEYQTYTIKPLPSTIEEEIVVGFIKD
jgi:hypothetical protein